MVVVTLEMCVTRYTNHSSAEKLFHRFLFVPKKRITYFEIEICFPPLVLGNYSKL